MFRQDPPPLITPPVSPQPVRDMDDKNDKEPSGSQNNHPPEQEADPPPPTGADATTEARNPKHPATAKRQALSLAEKIALASIAVFFLVLLIWGIMWLKQKNVAVNKTETLNLPLEGRYATLSRFSSYWKNVNKASPGIRFGAVVVPATTITLGKDSSAGALRIYFRNADMDGVGDPHTLVFQNGKFINGKDTIEIIASDGFHSRADFNSYQLDSDLGWKIEVLEAPSSTTPRSGFIPMTSVPISPALR